MTPFFRFILGFRLRLRLPSEVATVARRGYVVRRKGTMTHAGTKTKTKWRRIVKYKEISWQQVLEYEREIIRRHICSQIREIWRSFQTLVWQQLVFSLHSKSGRNVPKRHKIRQKTPCKRCRIALRKLSFRRPKVILSGCNIYPFANRTSDDRIFIAFPALNDSVFKC